MLNPKNPDYANTPISDRRPQFLYKPLKKRIDPVLSIITPFYNTGKLFEETLRSVMQQSLQQWEWLIINDGSTDDASRQILADCRKLDPRIRVIDHSENRGLPAARNTGAKEARTSYLLYMDSDDLLEPTAAEKWFWFLESWSQYSFVGGYSVGFGAHEFLWTAGFQNQEENLDRNQINHIIMIRKEVVGAVGGYDETMRQGLEDWDFWVRAANLGYWGDSIPEFLHWYRTRSSHTDRWEGLYEKQLLEKRNEFRQKYPQLWKGGFPRITKDVDINIISLKEDAPCLNELQKEKRRLLIIAPWLVTGGAEKFNLDLMRQLSKRGWELTIASTKASDNPWQHEYEAITPDVFPMHNFLEWKDYPRFLSYLIQSRQVDAILLSASQETYRLLPYLRNKFPKIPILDYVHFITPEWMGGGFPKLSELFNSSLDLSVVTSHQLKTWMIDNGVKADRIEVCTANVDIDAWHPDKGRRGEIRKDLGVTDSDALILYAGRLEKQKQPRVFAKTIGLLAEKQLPFVSLVIGDGSYMPWLREFVDKNQLNAQVRFLGEIPQERVQDLMKAGDIIFLPSENEGIALTIYEGMASGIVAVGADVGGQKELVAPDCGILVQRSKEDKEAEDYAHVLMGLILNPEKCKKMGRNSRKRVEGQFNLDIMGKRMESLLVKAGKMRLKTPRQPDKNELNSLLARQAVEYMRAVGELVKLKPYTIDYMPPAPASTYFYFTLRRLFLPVMQKFRQQKWFLSVKSRLKSLFIRGGKWF
jgi:glycosyltransferase involved in cell wall biosynthesis